MSTVFPWDNHESDNETAGQPVTWRAVHQADDSEAPAAPLTRRQRREQEALAARQGRLGRKKPRKPAQRPPAHSSGRISKPAAQELTHDTYDSEQPDATPVVSSDNGKRFDDITTQESEESSEGIHATHDSDGEDLKALPEEMAVQHSRSEEQEEPVVHGSSTPKEAYERELSTDKTPFTKKDAATVALAATALGLGTFTLIGDFSTPSTAYDAMTQTLQETTGEVTAKTYDESFCPSDAYSYPFSTEERNRAQSLDMKNTNGEPVICLDPPYILEVTDGDEVTRLPVEQTIFESFEIGDQYAYDPAQYENLSPSIRTTLPDEERTGLRLSLLGGAILLGGGVVALNLYPRRKDSDSAQPEGEEAEVKD